MTDEPFDPETELSAFGKYGEYYGLPPKPWLFLLLTCRLIASFHAPQFFIRSTRDGHGCAVEFCVKNYGFVLECSSAEISDSREQRPVQEAFGGRK
jgi:hypothetical protein